MQVFKRLFKALNDAGVMYLICGGVAVNLYGIERATCDIDLALSLDKQNLEKFISVAKNLGLKPKVPVKLEELIDSEKREFWKMNKNMTVFSLYDENAPFFIVDIFIDEPFDFKKVYNKRNQLMYDDIAIPVIPIDELIRMKEKTDRPQDIADVFYLRKIMHEWKDE